MGLLGQKRADILKFPILCKTTVAQSVLTPILRNTTVAQSFSHKFYLKQQIEVLWILLMTQTNLG